MIWCSGNLDRVMWGDEKKKKIKGYMLTTDVTGVQHGLTSTVLPLALNECVNVKVRKVRRKLRTRSPWCPHSAH